MAKITAKKKEIKNPVEISMIRDNLSKAIIKEYGSLAEFIKSDYCKKIGAENIRVYLSEKGGISLPLFTELCKHFCLGSLSREIKVERKVKYFLEK